MEEHRRRGDLDATHLRRASTRGRWIPDRLRPSTLREGAVAEPQTPAQGLRVEEHRRRRRVDGLTATRTRPFPSSRASWSPSHDSTAAVGTDSGVYGIFSPHGRPTGVGHEQRPRRKVVWALAVDPDLLLDVRAGTDNGLFRSSDGGVSWAPVTNGLPSTTITALKFAKWRTTSPIVILAGFWRAHSRRGFPPRCPPSPAP